MKYLSLLFVFALGACTETTKVALPAPTIAPATNAYAGSGVSDPSFKLPEGAGCNGAIARFRATIKNDLETGHTTQSVHERMAGELNSAQTACSAGQDASAQGQVRAIRARFGYPAG
jgi:hypothetical protein